LKRRLWKRATLSIRAQLGNLEGVLFPGPFEKQMEGSGKGASLINLIWALFLTLEFASGGNLELL
jgi:hypothetical protein